MTEPTMSAEVGRLIGMACQAFAVPPRPAQSGAVNEAEDLIPESITYLWDQVRDALKACGNPSPRDIDRLAASCGLKLSSSTIEGWFRTWSVVPAWEKLDTLLKALGAERDRDWKSLHGAAQLADRQRKAGSRRQEHKGHQPPAAPGPSPPVPAGAAFASSSAQHEYHRLQITAAVTHLPEIRARVTHIPDRNTVIFLSLGALLVIVAVAVFLSEAAPSQPGGTPRAGTTPAATPADAASSTGPQALPAWPLPSTSQLRTPPAAPAGAPTVLYVGDLPATESRNVLAYFVHRTGKARVVPADNPGAALCDYLAGRTETSSVPAAGKLPALVKKVKPRLVVLQFQGISSARTPCTGGAIPGSPDYHLRYQADARQAVQQVGNAARQAGIDRPKLVWVLQAPDHADSSRTRKLNLDTFKAVAESHSDLVSDAGWYVSQAAYPYERIPGGRYKWTQYLPCTEMERRYHYCTMPKTYGGLARFHNDGENIRYCLGPLSLAPRPCGTRSPGIVRYGQAIAQTVLQYLDTAPR